MPIIWHERANLFHYILPTLHKYLFHISSQLCVCLCVRQTILVSHSYRLDLHLIICLTSLWIEHIKQHKLIYPIYILSFWYLYEYSIIKYNNYYFFSTLSKWRLFLDVCDVVYACYIVQLNPIVMGEDNVKARGRWQDDRVNKPKTFSVFLYVWLEKNFLIKNNVHTHTHNGMTVKLSSGQ